MMSKLDEYEMFVSFASHLFFLISLNFVVIGLRMVKILFKLVHIESLGSILNLRKKKVFSNHRLIFLFQDLSNEKIYRCDDYEVRPLIITRGDTQRHVLLYHLFQWPDHDIPNNESFILDLLLRLYKDRDYSTESPILIHCRLAWKLLGEKKFSHGNIRSAGCGRTGSLIAIDLCRLLLNDEVRRSNQI